MSEPTHDAVSQSAHGVTPDHPAPTEPQPAELDLAAIERDLDGVERALERLDDGSYWSDEQTGEPISDEALAADPVARRAERAIG